VGKITTALYNRAFKEFHETVLTPNQRGALARTITAITFRRMQVREALRREEISRTMAIGQDKHLISTSVTGKQSYKRTRTGPNTHQIAAQGLKVAHSQHRANQQEHPPTYLCQSTQATPCFCDHKALTGRDINAITFSEHSHRVQMPWPTSSVPKHILEIGVGFRGWGVDYEGIKLPNASEQRMVCAHWDLFGHSVRFHRTRPIIGKGNTYRYLHKDDS
jgi:hypothetical protein